jgi:hypothetical protein
MAKAKTLSTLANPTRSFQLPNGETIPWKPLTLANLAELENEFGSLNDFLQALTNGHITPMLAIITKAIQNANPHLDHNTIATLFRAGDIAENKPAHQLLMQILQESGFTQAELQKKQNPQNQTG